MTDTGAAAVVPAGASVHSRQPLLAAALSPLVSATTWLAVIHLFSGFLIGVVALPLLLIGCILGCSLLTALPAGLAVFACTFWLCGLLARAERARFALLLGTQIRSGRMPPADTWWRAMMRSFLSAATWRHVAYALLRLPLGAVQAALVLVVWSQGLGFATIPTVMWVAQGGGTHLDGMVLHGFWPPFGITIAGLALLLAAPHVTRGLAIADAAVGGLLLGTDRRAELTARIGELETTRAAVMDAAEAERVRIERDLHDGAQQRLVALAMELGRARAKFDSDPQAAAAIVGEAHEQAKEALTELRNLVRGVHPPVLSDRGLDAALSGLAALSPVPVTLRVDLPVRPAAPIEAVAYFVVAEALTNVAKHAHARHAEVVVGREADLLTLAVSDDGCGGADQTGRGLSGLAARVAGVDGRLRVTSPLGGPTVIEVALPCRS